MYQSPISIYETAMNTIIEQRENAIVAKVQDAFDVHVDKEELIRALQYDRNQYDKGYADGKADAMAELVRCKDCKHYMEYPLNKVDKRMCCYVHILTPHFTPEDGFCSYGERKDNG